MQVFKKILIILAIVFTLSLILIAIPLIMFSKNYKVPTQQYAQTETYFMKHFDNEFQALVNDEDKAFIHTPLTEAYINQFIKNELFKDNPKYMDEAYKGELEYKYMHISSAGGMKAAIKGFFTDIKGNQIDVILSVDMLAGKTKLYQTGVLLRIDITKDDAGTHTLKVNRVVFGRTKLPLKNGIGMTNYIIKKINGKTLEAVINDALPFGKYDPNNIAVVVEESDIIDYVTKAHVGYGTLIKLIYDHDLLAIDVVDDGIDLGLAIGKLRRPLTDPNQPTFDPLTSPEEQVAFMTSLNTRLLAGFIANPVNPYVDLTEIETNKIVDYALKDNVKFNQEFPIKISPTETVLYNIKSSNLFITMVDQTLKLHLEFTISRENIIKTFNIQLNMNSTIEKVGDDIVITMLDAKISDIDLTHEEVMAIVDMYNPGMFENGKLTITKQQLNEMFLGAEMTIDDVEVINGQFRIHYTYVP